MSRKDVVPRAEERNRGHVRCGCNARLSVVKQQMGEGWVVSTFVEEHNHPLATPSRQVRLLEIEAGGPSSIGCVEKDIRNYQRDVRQEMLGHDAETLIEHFTFEKEKNPNFVFDYETDDENKFVRCFWADCELRRSYAYFGDVVVFDTTYNTNKYSMVFSPFVGVNHLGQTVIFGCGLLSDETTESFVWLFTKFIEAMPNHAAPEVIITDQDAANARAISIVLPSTLHRFCMWHILNKFSEKMNVVLYNDQYHRLVHIIKKSESPAEFEQQWIGVMETRVRALVHQRHEELAANYIDLTQTPNVTTALMMENQMVQIYTKKIFVLFQNELVQSNSYICSKRSSSDEAKVYAVQRFEPGRTSDRTHQVNYFLSTDYISFSCQMFDFEGYPCRHILCYMKKKQVMLLPEKYILRRWTKNAKQARVFDPTTGSYVHTDPGHSLMSMAYLRIRVKDINTDGEVNMSRNRNKSVEKTQVVCNPNPVRAKGCEKHLKSEKEKALSQSNRQCRACGTSGHDRRTCPTLQNRSNLITDGFCFMSDLIYDESFSRSDFIPKRILILVGPHSRRVLLQVGPHSKTGLDQGRTSFLTSLAPGQTSFFYS
ncbi:Protein FAR1-RELATED SEQUENCE 3 [Abeliophyllum distichum]|uniref:Protein FAR1-RELATED SEQUENCE 3 n=1 Tax=Abeliophyllum distichum TaxID=126358 RepID=A0ABD1VQU8_9LAMI